MRAQTCIRAGVLVFIVGTALILGVAGALAGSIRTRLIFVPREQGAEQAIRQVAEREKALHAARGNFVAFSNSDVEKNTSLLGLPWRTFGMEDYFFDAAELDSGDLRLRALPRPDPVAALSIRARLYIAELSPKGKMVHSGWYPAAE